MTEPNTNPKPPEDTTQGVETEEREPLIKVIRSEEPEGLQITWKDGLPDDPFERAQIEQILVTSGLTSKYSAIKRLLDGDDAAAEEEMRRIEEEQQASQMAEAAMGMGMAPPQDATEAQELRGKMVTEREEQKEIEKEAAKEAVKQAKEKR